MKRTIVPRGMLTLSLAVVLTPTGLRAPNLPNTASKTDQAGQAALAL